MTEQSYLVNNLQLELTQRLIPTITVWNRLEGRPRTLNFDRALRAEVRDALWMLTRQWQLGEFQGDDAGSPVLAKLHLTKTELQKYQPADHPAQPLELDVPLEAKVERRPIPFQQANKPLSLDLRLQMGRHWLKLLAPIAPYAQAFKDAYPIQPPADDPAIVAHPDAWSMVSATAGRHMDGGTLYLHLKASPANHAYDGIAAVQPADFAALDALAQRFVAWFERLYYQPASDRPDGGDAWLPDRLEYRFTCSAPQPAGEKVLKAEQYYHGHLDWYNFDVDPTAPPLDAPLPPPVPAPEGDEAAVFKPTQTFIPTQITFDGMPNTRWWAFEDSRTNFGDIKPDTTDLSKLLLIEFGLVYANDWFLLPYTLPAGSIANIQGMAVTNVFNERIWVEAAGRGQDDNWQRWSMFTINIEGQNNEAADTSLLILPSVPKIQEGKPLEQVALIRDEMANMVWGIEKVIPLVTGWGKSGSEAAAETLALYQRQLAQTLEALRAEQLTLEAINPRTPAQDARLAEITDLLTRAAPITYNAPIRYQVMNTVPENWIPFIPVHLENDNREIQLQRAAMPRLLEGDPNPLVKVRPRTTLLRHGLDQTPAQPYFLHEEEVLRAGVQVQQIFKRTRWSSGRVFTWLGVSKQTGRGEGGSGLAFDQIPPTPAPPAPSA